MRIVYAPLALACIYLTSFGTAQTRQMPHDYPGVSQKVPGIYVTPVAGAPFSAKVDIISQLTLPDGTVDVRTSVAHVARQSTGRIYNELRSLVPTTYKGDPPLLSSHIYDPTTRLNIFLNPFTHLAHESVLERPPAAPAGSVPARALNTALYKEEDLGTQYVGTVELKGIRKSRTIPANQSGTGHEVVVVDEYWYSPDLSIYMIIKHTDPRTGEQTVAVSEVDRKEPEAAQFNVPARYRVVDETPAE